MRAPGVIFAVLVVIVAGEALAEVEGEARARALFEQGLAAAEAGDLSTAAERLSRSYELYPHPGTLLNLAAIHDRVGADLEAYRAYRELLDRFGEAISQEARLDSEARLGELEARLALVRLSTAPQGATVLIDGREVGETPFVEPIALEPGEHRFRGRLEGYDDTTSTRTLRAGTLTTVDLTFSSAGDEPEDGPEPIEAPEEGHALPPPPAAPRRPLWRRAWFWSVIGVAVAGALAATLAVTLSGDDDSEEAAWRLRFP